MRYASWCNKRHTIKHLNYHQSPRPNVLQKDDQIELEKSNIISYYSNMTVTPLVLISSKCPPRSHILFHFFIVIITQRVFPWAKARAAKLPNISPPCMITHFRRLRKRSSSSIFQIAHVTKQLGETEW
jgi:hypothetical protein